MFVFGDNGVNLAWQGPRDPQTVPKCVLGTTQDTGGISLWYLYSFCRFWGCRIIVQGLQTPTERRDPPLDPRGGPGPGWDPGRSAIQVPKTKKKIGKKIMIQNHLFWGPEWFPGPQSQFLATLIPKRGHLAPKCPQNGQNGTQNWPKNAKKSRKFFLLQITFLSVPDGQN